MLDAQNTALVVVDIQEKLWAAMHDKEALAENTVRIVRGAILLGIPILRTEQNPRGLGPTLPRVAEILQGSEPVTKLSFSSCGEKKFTEKLRSLHCTQILLTGIESHVCVYQTAADLLHMGYEVQVVADAISSRTPENKSIGLERCKTLGAAITSTETALFELLKEAKGESFKEMLKLVK